MGEEAGKAQTSQLREFTEKQGRSQLCVCVCVCVCLLMCESVCLSVSLPCYFFFSGQFIVKWQKLESHVKREAQLRHCFHQIGVYEHVRDIFLVINSRSHSSLIRDQT